MRGFSITEFEERLTRARLLMQEKKIEMLLITSPHNFRYFTGFDSYFWESPTRPWFLLLSLNHRSNSNCSFHWENCSSKNLD